MRELDRLLREMRNAKSTAEVQGVLRLSMACNLSREERQQLKTAVPESYRTSLDEPESVRVTISTLEAMNVHSGLATQWSREFPWRDNPWQLIQISAARAVIHMMPLFPATVRVPLLRMAHAFAIGDKPSVAWVTVERLASEFPSGAHAQKILTRFVMSAWNTMQRHKQDPASLMEAWIPAAAKALRSTMSPAELASSCAEARAAAGLRPEQVVQRFTQGSSELLPAALPDLVTVASLLEHVKTPATAELWLNRFLVDDLRPT